MIKFLMIFSVTAALLFVAVGLNIHMQHFNQDSNTTATSGWYFKTTLNLEEYKNVSTGNNLWGKFDRYTRSDRHTEVIEVYCNDFCKK